MCLNFAAHTHTHTVINEKHNVLATLSVRHIAKRTKLNVITFPHKRYVCAQCTYRQNDASNRSSCYNSREGTQGTYKRAPGGLMRKYVVVYVVSNAEVLSIRILCIFVAISLPYIYLPPSTTRIHIYTK